jgi:DNA-binding response OmpR family regulator
MTSPLYGADAYLDKPFELTDLDEAVTQVLAERGFN